MSGTFDPKDQYSLNLVPPKPKMFIVSCEMEDMKAEQAAQRYVSGSVRVKALDQSDAFKLAKAHFLSKGYVMVKPQSAKEEK